MDIRQFMKRKSSTDRRSVKIFQHERLQAGDQNGYFPLEIGTKNQKFLENLKSAV